MLQSNQWGNEEFKTTNGIEFVVPTEVTETLFPPKNVRNKRDLEVHMREIRISDSEVCFTLDSRLPELSLFH